MAKKVINKKKVTRTAPAKKTTKAILPDGGKREMCATGGVREPATGKGRFDLISPFVMLRDAKHYENGASKYAERNWEKGLPDSRCFDSAVRHLYRWLAGDQTEDHLAAARWNIAALMHYEETIPQSNNVVHDLHMAWRTNEWPKTSIRGTKFD